MSFENATVWGQRASRKVSLFGVREEENADPAGFRTLSYGRGDGPLPGGPPPPQAPDRAPEPEPEAPPVTPGPPPKPKAAHDCLDFSDKGDCTVDAGVVVVQEGRKVERKMIESVERIKAIDGQRKGDGQYDMAPPQSTEEQIRARLGLEHLSPEQFAMAVAIFGGLVVFIVGAYFVAFRRR